MPNQRSKRKIYDELIKYGRKLVREGLVFSHFGNISVRSGEKIYISRRGSMLDELDDDEIVEVDVDRVTEADSMASSETVVHRRIYTECDASSIIHTHSPFAVTISMIIDEEGRDLLEPIDSEGRSFLGEVPIVKGEAGTEELADRISSALKDHKGAIVHAHGCFTIGKTLKDAFVVA